MINWVKTLKNGELKAKKYMEFCNQLLMSSPDKIEIPSSMLPVIMFSDDFVPGSNTPLTGDYICGTLNGVDVEVKNDLHDQVVLKHMINIIKE